MFWKYLSLPQGLIPLLSVILPLFFAGASSGGDFEVVSRLFTIELKTDPMKHPSDVAVSKDGSIYVLDGVNNRVLVFNAAGGFLFKFGKGGSDKGEMNFPLGLCLDGEGRVYVADSGNHRVQMFTSDGRYINQIDLKGVNGNKPPDPTDVAVDEQKKVLYIVDNDNHKIYVYDLKAGSITKSLGEMGMRDDGFRWPFTIAIDKDGYLYIVDVINTRVRVISPDGGFANDIGEWGVDWGQFFRPKGVAVDSKDRVYVTDSYTGTIQVFDKKGKIIAALGDETGKVRKFVTPVRIFVDDSDRIFVVEMFANRVGVYKKKG
ncbi:MAG: NHL repeat-containing protein [Deltaproteobacteria bacterium]|nr:NHL repeat-containing protein [Deltaproteobacteria bacterium]